AVQRRGACRPAGGEGRRAESHRAHRAVRRLGLQRLGGARPRRDVRRRGGRPRQHPLEQQPAGAGRDGGGGRGRSWAAPRRL
ncbi:MAG: hypothetical protein AVDCRST_MAG08-1826, partial [uncultured Acetobacteraceae bacterium]